MQPLECGRGRPILRLGLPGRLGSCVSMFRIHACAKSLCRPASDTTAWIALVRQALHAVPCGNWRSFTSSASLDRALPRPTPLAYPPAPRPESSGAGSEGGSSLSDSSGSSFSGPPAFAEWAPFGRSLSSSLSLSPSFLPSLSLPSCFLSFPASMREHRSYVDGDRGLDPAT